jgi:hypothetical protein
MTFEQFQATKRQVSVTHEGVKGYCFADGTEECLLYAGGLIIECRPGDRYLLALPMQEWVDERLEPLERRLYEFGTGEDCVNAATT